ncbi:hypothetical protein [Mycobacterium montefiorense]|uniref:AttH domain-containing protein n=1 Tax=Mycobacterium montefiorense TaxID=154654 RepID=A0AA37UZT1_9MYCO|nr:hypothetical protein [Mycobacterium montefiorense]GBG40572.1 hypothetical protein MmonteBS_49440 [Mycobacterium montefiorense]GKU37981.1 hypothetical protein NJB14191_53270 [Mycobacterium montefiorense]GKU39259.1 hypothetical protein NJB14192_12540 [Mycobacterium montefiorense]GKU44752.1 hypothetical protein NJB14194_13780 [Mycobacterium montefiorense]GKU53815.1 hypothetical protein NJB14195_50560 [Mycobacterium montefiorense]
MDDEMRSAAAPRWKGAAGRLEVWYATLSDPQTHAGLWIHGETVAPTQGGDPYAHGWATWFPPDGPPHTERFGPVPALAAAGATWFDAGGIRVGPEGLTGQAGALAWELSWTDAGKPLWTFPRVAWERELLPGAQVVVAPTADFTGSLTIGAATRRVDGWRGALAHIYGHGNAKRWGWIHADLGGGDVLEVVTAVSHKPGLRRLAPMAFIRFRIDGKDWPASPLPALRMRTTLQLGHWQLKGRIGNRAVSIRVDQPEQRCVSLRYTDPDGDTAVCTNTEQADIHVEISHREGRTRVVDHSWSVLGTGHAEVGLR